MNNSFSTQRELPVKHGGEFLTRGTLLLQVIDNCENKSYYYKHKY